MRENKVKNKFWVFFLGSIFALILLEIILRLASFTAERLWLPRYSFSPLNKNIRTIVCLGDSFTYGIGAGFENAYPAQLEEMLNKKFQKEKFKVYNLGVSGANSAFVLNKLKNMLGKISPDFVVVLVGANDSWNFESGAGADNWDVRVKIIMANFKLLKLTAVTMNNLKYCLIAQEYSQGRKHFFLKQDDINKLIAQANDFREKHDFKNAERIYKQAMFIKGWDALVLLELGRLYKLMNRYEEAISVLRKALFSEPEFEEVYFELDDIFVNQKKFKEQVSFYESIYGFFPRNTFVKKRLLGSFIAFADYCYLKGDYGSVIFYYEKALELDPDNESIYTRIYYNKALGKIGKKTAKMRMVEKIARENPRLNIDDYVQENMYNNLTNVAQICRTRNIELIFSDYPEQSFAAVKSVAEKYKVSLVDNSAVFKKNLAGQKRSRYFILADDHHCTKEGYAIIAENIAEAIIKIIEK
ncbi:MAG: tetratricopeptide repeat protein [Candidatus Omnitrophica bacterium]|nr:tetratricopeptide repeat protein [Candidatus Omnitrophota bacterium]